MSWMPLSFSPTFPLLPYFSTENTKEGFRYNPLIESLKEERKKEGRKERKKNRADSMLSFDRRNCFVAAREGKKRVFPPFFSLRFLPLSNYFPTKTVYNAPPVAERKNPAKAYRKRKLFL